MVYAVIPDTSVTKIRRSWSKAIPGKILRPYLKNNLKAKGLESVVQVVGYLLNKQLA
jgi:uncharacterized protein (UPF0297 family)